MYYNGTDYVRLAIGTAGQVFQTNGSTAPSWVSASGDVTIATGGAVTIANDAVNEAKTADSDGTSGLYVMKYAQALYDFSTDGGGAPGAITLTDVCTLPDNAVVELVSYDVLTTCTTAGADAGTIKVGLVTDGDLSTAIAVSDGSNPWDAGAHLASVVTPLIVKTTAARAIVVTSTGQAITAGKIVFCFRYYVTS
jgi:hypothetical protein